MKTYAKTYKITNIINPSSTTYTSRDIFSNTLGLGPTVQAVIPSENRISKVCDVQYAKITMRVSYYARPSDGSSEYEPLSLYQHSTVDSAIWITSDYTPEWQYGLGGKSTNDVLTDHGGYEYSFTSKITEKVSYNGRITSSDVFTTENTTGKVTLHLSAVPRPPSAWSQYYDIRFVVHSIEVEVVYAVPNSVPRFDGSQWKICSVKRFDGSDWKKCVMYYYDGTQWKLCSGG